MPCSIHRFCLSALYSFAVLFIVFIPFPFHFFPNQHSISEFLFLDFVRWIGALFHTDLLPGYGFSSDSASMYLLTGILATGASFLAVVGHGIKGSILQRPALYAWLDRFFLAYLTLIWFSYGFEKVFKHQFYLPEPNILYTPFCKLDPDILFWSLMGSSYSYSLVLGGTELLAGAFLIFRNTRFTGLLLSLVILAQILTVNLCFDISLKLFTVFLILVTLILLRSKLRSLFLFLFRNQFLEVKEHILQWPKGGLRHGCKALFFLLLLFEGMSPFWASGNWNDDLVPRPYLHGAYEVTNNETSTFQIKRFFVHRDDYLIFQMEDDEMKDFQLLVNRGENTLICKDNDGKTWPFSFQFSTTETVLLINSLDPLRPLQLKGKALNWRSLPALSPSFYWTMEGHFSDSTQLSGKTP